MNVLVLNAGSSSLKAGLVDSDSGECLARHNAERVDDHAAALMELLPKLLEAGPVHAVGHRVVHGGSKFSAPTLIDDATLDAIEALIPLAPLHNPANLSGIRAARQALPALPHVAVFDTAFHASLPRRARTYALPAELSHVRRYGFHGSSHAFVARRAADWLGEDLRDLRIITCHLGNGASVCAVEYGSSVETSMGMTPLEGLVMGTRSGDLDPGIVLQLLRDGRSIDEVDTLLNRQSGLTGLSGVGNDMRDIEERAAGGDDRARQAIQVFTHRLRKYIGAYTAVMGGVDVIAFTGGIGENSALIRHRACQRLDYLGARLDEDRNRDAQLSHESPVAEISQARSRVKLLAVATDEAYEIARETSALARREHEVASARAIPVAVSARHVHLTPDAVEALFGPGATLTPLKPLSQPGQFACEETVTLIGPKRTIEGVRVLGPTRPKCQVEISRTDEFWLGIDAPVRPSGDVENTPGITLGGSEGRQLTIAEGVICAWRHIHMTTADAEHFGVKHRDVVEVAFDSAGRDLIFGDVMVRVKDSYALEMHIDTDEANAADLARQSEGLLVSTGGFASIRRRRTRYD